MPQNWKTYKFSELFDIASGLSKSRDQFGHGSPFVTFKDVFYNYFLPEELGDLANTNTKEQERGSIKKGDILLTRTSETLHELGMSSVALKDYPNSTFNGFCKRLRPIKEAEVKIDPLFIGYY
jgi:type I restriction enzyme S subunit